MRRIHLAHLLAVLLALPLAGCGGGNGSSGTTSTVASSATTTEPGATTTESGPPVCKTVAQPPTAERTAKKPTARLDPAKTYEVTFLTNCGSFTIAIDQAQSPNTAASFVSLAQAGFFDKTMFHRIVRDFVIQGGDPTATGTGGPGYSTVDTPPADASYRHGVVAMAKAGAEPPGTGGSQFFIVTGTDAPLTLTPDYAIVGRVKTGLDVVDAIGQLGDLNEQPTQVVVIEKATVSIS